MMVMVLMVVGDGHVLRRFQREKEQKALVRSRDAGRGGRGAQSADSIDAGGIDPFVMVLYGTAAAANKSLRRELISFRDRRDKYLMKHFQFLRPFLSVKVHIQ